MIETIANIGSILPVGLAAIAILLIMCSLWLSWPWLQGMLGESKVKNELKRLKKGGALLMHNITLPDSEGNAVHIPHLVIDRCGIITVETLAYPGIINGSLREGYWQQEFKGGRIRFANPERHRRQVKDALTKLIGPDLEIHSATVFTAGELEGSMPAGVMTTSNLRAYLTSRKPSPPNPESEKKARALKEAFAYAARADKHYLKNLRGEFIAQQGLEQRLGVAKALMLLSVLAMSSAIATAVLTILYQRGIL